LGNRQTLAHLLQNRYRRFHSSVLGDKMTLENIIKAIVFDVKTQHTSLDSLHEWIETHYSHLIAEDEIDLVINHVKWWFN
jgi:hypothetical protein